MPHTLDVAERLVEALDWLSLSDIDDMFTTEELETTDDE